jgi:hypothetical protein
MMVMPDCEDEVGSGDFELGEVTPYKGEARLLRHVGRVTSAPLTQASGSGFFLSLQFV